MQKHVSDCLLEKQAQLSAAQSHTEELDADLDRLVALKRQVDKATGHEGPRPGSLLPSQPQLHTSTGTACPGPGQARARRDPPSTSVVRAWPWAPGLRSSPRSQRPPSRRPHPGGGGRIEAKEPSERVLGGDRGSGETRGGAGGAAGGAAGGRRRPRGADHLRVRLAGGEGAGHPSRGHRLSPRCGGCSCGRPRPLSCPPSLSAGGGRRGSSFPFAPPDADLLSRPRTFPSSWPCRHARSTCRR